MIRFIALSPNTNCFFKMVLKLAFHYLFRTNPFTVSLMVPMHVFDRLFKQYYPNTIPMRLIFSSTNWISVFAAHPKSKWSMVNGQFSYKAFAHDFVKEFNDTLPIQFCSFVYSISQKNVNQVALVVCQVLLCAMRNLYIFEPLEKHMIVFH